ncbi:MAG: sulfotransferase [Acetobacteraceae bacterium]
MSIQSGALRALDAVALRLGLLRGPFAAEQLMVSAVRRTGLDDFGDQEIHEPLRRLLSACDAEASLGVVGRVATKWDITRFLTNLLRMREAERRAPSIGQEPIERPIFITGVPRSGTTFLHRLMMADAESRAPLVWETIYPYADARQAKRDSRIADVDRQLRAFERLAPEFRALHPLDATSPQECSEISAHVFRSLRFDTNYQIPSYRHWLDGDVGRHVPGYRFHKRFLQHLQHRDGQERRWVLKCPEHVFALEAIRQVYPDARLVFVHRDPVKVLLSVAKLTEVLRRPFTRRLDPRTIGRDESRRWMEGTTRMMAADDEAGFPEPICHVHYMDLISDPLATVDSVYRHFGMTLPDAAQQAITRYVRERPNGGYGPRDYRFEDHGLNEAEERETFRPYMIRFGVVAEAAPKPRAPGRTAPVPLRAEQDQKD